VLLLFPSFDFNFRFGSSVDLGAGCFQTCPGARFSRAFLARGQVSCSFSCPLVVLDADLFFSKLVQRPVKSLPLGDSSFTTVFRSPSTALNAFVISSLVLMLSPICSLLPPKYSQH
jgi:hypothetical protein